MMILKNNNSSVASVISSLTDLLVYPKTQEINTDKNTGYTAIGSEGLTVVYRAKALEY